MYSVATKENNIINLRRKIYMKRKVGVLFFASQLFFKWFYKIISLCNARMRSGE